MPASRKICNLEQLLALRTSAREAGKSVVHCHGCFDVVHPGHIHHLQHARSLGDMLIVSISSDAHVNKGVSRPLIPDDLRAASLAALAAFSTSASLMRRPTPASSPLGVRTGKVASLVKGSSPRRACQQSQAGKRPAQ